MINRRKSPDGLPFRLYMREGKTKVSYGYKLPGGKWAFRLSAKKSDTAEVARIRRIAIEKAEAINGVDRTVGATATLVRSYFDWQYSLPGDSEMRKADGTLKENEREAKNLTRAFGAMPPGAIKPTHVYQYLDARGRKAPAKANKEIALLSAILEYGRRRGYLETNPCSGIKYNKTKPRQKYVGQIDVAYALAEARRRGGSYLILALCVKTAYLTVSRPTEMRELTRRADTPGGLQIPVGKRKAGQAQKHKMIEWSPELRKTIDEALTLQRTMSLFIFGNTDGQVYTRSGWTTIWTRLMGHCEAKAKKEGVFFTRFTLADMRPAAVTDRKEAGDVHITDATGHSDERMVNKTYDRRRVKTAKPTM